MPLRFLTQNQQFIFVDHDTHEIVHPGAIRPGSKMDVYVVLENTDKADHTNVQVNVWHIGFGNNSTPTTIGLTQPPPVNVPMEIYENPGKATVSFSFRVPSSGMGFLKARIAPAGATIGQNITICECSAENGPRISCMAI